MSDTLVRMDPAFADLLRDALQEQVERTQPRSSRRRLWIIGSSLGVIVLGGAGAAAAGLLVQPGGTITAQLGDPVETTGSGTQAIELGAIPEGATGISIDFSCADAGHFGFGVGGASMTCNAEDAGGRTGQAWGNLPLSTLQGTVLTITATDDARWSLTVSYVNETISEWSTNSDGQTYGVMNQNGDPDLVLVVATNGREGYVRSDDLADADGSTAAESFTSPEEALEWQESMQGARIELPVYESDGRTIVGVFVIEYPE